MIFSEADPTYSEQDILKAAGVFGVPHSSM